LQINEITGAIVDAALKVHTTLGPGLFESVYEACLIHELKSRGLDVASQVALPVIYGKVRVEAGFRIDLLVEDAVVVEIKSVEELAPIHSTQVLTYLRLSGKPVGLLINFNVTWLKNGIKRFVSDEHSVSEGEATTRDSRGA
jgi:GxxExxY protein